MSGFFFTLSLPKNDSRRIIIDYESNACSSCSFDTLDNSWSPRFNLYYPSKDGGVTILGLFVTSLISSVDNMNTIQAIVVKDAYKT